LAISREEKRRRHQSQAKKAEEKSNDVKQISFIL
jgi:hypothetical protein